MRVQDIDAALDESIGTHLKKMALGSLVSGGIAAASVLNPAHEPVHPQTHRYEVPDFDMDMDTSTTPKENHALTDMKAMALAMFAEARGEGVKGMRAVGHVIANRVNSKMNAASKYRLYGKTVKDVVLNDKAFSAWNSDDANRSLIDDIIQNGPANLNEPDQKAFMAAEECARAVMSGEDKDLTNGADHYHAVGVKPWWTKKRKGHPSPVMTAKIGRHVFYNRINTVKTKRNKKS